MKSRSPACSFPALVQRFPRIGVEPGTDCWLWGSVLIRGGATLLAALTNQLGRLAGPGECQISLSPVGPSRAKLLDLRPSDPVLVLTH